MSLTHHETTLAMVEVKGCTREYLLSALRNLTKFDADFSGENGEDSNWNVTTKCGFKSNEDYLIDYVSKCKTDDEVVDTYMKLFRDFGRDYYIDVKYATIKHGNQITAISVAVTN